MGPSDNAFPYLYLPKHYIAEREIAVLLSRLAKHKPDPVPDWHLFVDGLATAQKQAVERAMHENFHCTYGGPGTGKTTISQRIIRAFDNAGMTGLIVAPTNKAKKRGQEVIWQVKENLTALPACKTSYRSLDFKPNSGVYSRNFRNPFDVDYIFFSEFGFAGCTHLRDFLLAIKPERTRLVVEGDPFQLPPVEAGCVCRDVINSGYFSCIELTEVFRTGANSGIAINAARILKGEMPTKIDPCTGEEFQDWKIIISRDEENTQKLLLRFIQEDIPRIHNVDPVKDIQLISPGKRSKVGTEEMNKVLREALNPGRPRFRGFRINDKVINRKNYPHDLEIYNGDVGYVIDIGDYGMTVDFGPGSGSDGTGKVQIENEHADSIFLNYAQTVHSSQGSEMPVAITPLHRCHWNLLSRNLLYTAPTRARKLAVIVCEEDALRECLAHSETVNRHTGLCHWFDSLAKVA